MPEVYTHGHHESVLRSHRWRTAENSAAYLLPRLDAGQRLLDVGCGPGNLTADLASRVGSVVAIDNAPAAVAACSAELAERGVDNATVEVVDVYRLPYADDSFDVVHAHQVLQHLPDPVGALVEMRRVCRPDGVVAVRDSDYPAMFWYPADPRLDRWMALYLRIARSNSGEPAAARHLVAWCRAAGFSGIEPSGSAWVHATPDDREYWGAMWADRVTESALADQALESGLATRAELEEIAVAWRRWAADPDGWFTSTHGEVLGTP